MLVKLEPVKGFVVRIIAENLPVAISLRVCCYSFGGSEVKVGGLFYSLYSKFQSRFPLLRSGGKSNIQSKYAIRHVSGCIILGHLGNPKCYWIHIPATNHTFEVYRCLKMSKNKTIVFQLSNGNSVLYVRQRIKNIPS